MPPPILKPRADEIRMPSLGLVGLLSGSGFSQVLVGADVKTWLNIGIADVSGLSTQLADKAALSGSYADPAWITSLAASKLTGVISAGNLPSYVDDVLEFANLAAFPVTGETGKIYVALNTGRTYRWSGSAYVELTDSTAVWGQISGFVSNQTDLAAAFQPLNSNLTQFASDGIASARDQVYSGTITWTGTTAPSGTATLRYTWERVGKCVEFVFRFEWTTNGSALTAAQFPFPAGMPAPATLTGQSNSEVVLPVNCLAGGFGVGGTATGNQAEARIQLDASGNPELRARFPSTTLGFLSVAGSYPCP